MTKRNFTDEDIDSIGGMLEEKGMSHSEIDIWFEHAGVKGMKWGVTRAEKKTAQSNIKAIGKDARSAIKASKKAKTSSERQKAAADYKKNVYDKVRSKEFKDDIRTATTLTKGEKVATVILTGGLGALTMRQMKNNHLAIVGANVGAEKEISGKIYKDLKS